MTDVHYLLFMGIMISLALGAFAVLIVCLIGEFPRWVRRRGRFGVCPVVNLDRPKEKHYWAIHRSGVGRSKNLSNMMMHPTCGDRYYYLPRQLKEVELDPYLAPAVKKWKKRYGKRSK